MKIYNNLSICALAGLFAFTSCTKEDGMEGGSVAQPFQISVSDRGFQGISDGRAVDENYKTTFVAGDVVGVYGVAGGQVVEGISNRKFTLNEKGVWELEGNPIEYDSELFKTITFYAYYPYQDNVAFNPAVEDPFADFVANWQIAADQGGSKYTKSDLMTSTSQAEAGRLQGKVTFTMNHRMALAVLKMPTLVYDFTNGGLDDYSLNVAPKELLINDVKTTPYYDAASGTYMALVKPETNYSISGTYQGAKEMAFSAAGSLAGGKAKMYTINDPNKINHTLQVGDYLCADGNLVSMDAGTVPDNAIGVVCYVGNPQPHVTHPDNCTETNDALYRDYPNCTHGLVLALNNANEVIDRFSSKGLFSTWFTSDNDWSDKFIGCNTGNSTSPIVMYPGYLGYNNTTLLTMCYEKGNTSPCTTAYSNIMSYRERVITPSASSVWFLPNLAELDLVYQNMNILNKQILAARGNDLISTTNGESNNFYWSSNERNDSFMWVHHMDGGTSFLNRRDNGTKGYFRMMLAF